MGGRGHWAFTVTDAHSSDPDTEPCQDRSSGAANSGPDPAQIPVMSCAHSLALNSGRSCLSLRSLFYRTASPSHVETVEGSE